MYGDNPSTGAAPPVAKLLLYVTVYLGGASVVVVVGGASVVVVVVGGASVVVVVGGASVVVGGGL
jgi:hypothetical protein